jgi:hypothetical protein
MFKVINENYYVDLDKIEEYTSLKSTSGETQVHFVKYETIKFLWFLSPFSPIIK